MARSNLISSLDSTQPVFVGIDVHKTKWSVCIIHQDEVIENHTIPGDYCALKPILDKYSSCKVYSVYEAGFLGFYLHRKLEKDNIISAVVSPNKIPVEVGNYVKTDRRDAHKLAFSLSKKLIRSIYIPSEELDDFRQILRTREKIVRCKRSATNRIKMMLLKHEIKFAKTSLTIKQIEELKALELPENTKFALLQLIEQFELYRKQSTQLASKAHALATKSSHVSAYNIINTIPGVGPIVACMICFEIGDFKRFTSGKKLAAYIGITPREFSSGENVYKGRITGQGNKIVRSYIIESSWSLIGKDPAMKEYYNRIKSNTGSGKKAIVAVARKLINRIYSIVINNQCYTLGQIY